ncbi:MAG: hypothetical protein BZY87_06645 [SAR202 cluster bacterium Io17-Chloro-G6]|nr:MAG: hypothetical protein BZY87_06645 [SAR202 cluster bacterium Io17-Chloro-G6]
MPANSPEQTAQLLADALKAGDLEAAVALYEADAIFIPDLGQSVTGAAAIREAFAGFVAAKPILTIETVVSAISGDIALIQNNWTMKTTEADGSPVEGTGQSVEALRRQADGTWKFVIDNPWGAR